jgi:hypothetical protein
MVNKKKELKSAFGSTFIRPTKVHPCELFRFRALLNFENQRFVSARFFPNLVTEESNCD